MSNLSHMIARRITRYNDPNSLVNRRRRRRILPLLEMIEEVGRDSSKVEILDIGGTREYWNIVPEEILERHDVRFTLVNVPGAQPPMSEGRFEAIEGDGCDLSKYTDSSFDIVHSNSVIEHVGDWARVSQFASEVRRLAPRYFVQTPNFWFPIEPHFVCPFFHWLPEPIRVRLVMSISLGHYGRAADVGAAVESVQSARLLTKSMMSWLFPNANIEVERFGGLPKSLLAIKR